MTDFDPHDITLRAEDGSTEDREFLRKLFCSLDQVQSLLQMGDQGEQLIEMQLRAREQQYRAMFPNGSFDLVLLDDEPIGRIATDRSSEPWSLIDIAILPEFRSQRIGSTLVKNLLRSARDENCQVSASVMACNVRARTLWLQLGFKVVEEQLDYWSLLYSPDKPTDESPN